MKGDSLMDRLLEAVNKIPGVSVKLQPFSDEEHSCTRKVRYVHRESADQAARLMGKKLGRRMVAYPCRYCDGWHVGSQ
ncbi:MAG: hypothetical protein DRP83_00670 [Planctomycetota bacterium]|nr:MAG: hypothetical protein DRP83_00670 [Planctomycetota bacterium]